MKTSWRMIITLVLLAAISLLFLLPTGSTGRQAVAAALTENEEAPAFYVSDPVKPGISPAVRDLPDLKEEKVGDQEINPRRIPPLLPEKFFLDPGTREVDPLIEAPGNNLLNTPATSLSFEGISATGYVPPDTIGDVGPNHYVQMVNTSFAIYDKNGNLLDGPHPINQLWQGQGNLCASQNGGDPIVLSA